MFKSLLTNTQVHEMRSQLIKTGNNIGRVKLDEQISNLMKDNSEHLERVMNSAWAEVTVNRTPYLKKYIGSEELRKDGKPLKGEIKLINEIADYLFGYYGIPKNADSLSKLQEDALSNPNSIKDTEAFYEINQLFSAFGHTAVDGINEDRVKRVKLYKERERVYNPHSKYHVMAMNIAIKMQSGVVPYIKGDVNQSNDPFTGIGPKNDGTPYWRKDTTKMSNGETIRSVSRKLTNTMYNKYFNQKLSIEWMNNILRIVQSPITIFGRNSTKGFDYEFKDNSVVVKIFKASGRSILAVPKFINRIIAKAYSKVMEHDKKLQFLPSLHNIEKQIQIYEKRRKVGTRLKWYVVNTDIGKYDTSVTIELMADQAIIDFHSWAVTEAQQKIVVLNFLVDSVMPILYSPEPGKIDLLYKSGGHSSGIDTTFDWGSKMVLVCAIASMLEVDEKWTVYALKTCFDEGVSLIYDAGDDISLFFKDRLFAQRWREVMTMRYGYEFNEAKDVPGYAYVQFFPNTKGGWSFPLARSLRSFYYPERDWKRSMGYYGLTVKNWTLVYQLHIAGSPHTKWLIDHIKKNDSSKLGHVDQDGKVINVSTFMKRYSAEMLDFSNGVIADLKDPKWKEIYNDKGELKSEWITLMWEITK